MKEMEEMKLIYFQVTDVWQKLCEKHSELLDLTYDEYSALLASDIDRLNNVVDKKDSIVSEIEAIDLLRSELILKVKSHYPNEKIERVSDLLRVLATFEKNHDESFLSKFNSILVSIIEQIQDQNRKNQVFLNKAIMSLERMKTDITGKNNYSTYNDKGVST